MMGRSLWDSFASYSTAIVVSTLTYFQVPSTTTTTTKKKKLLSSHNYVTLTSNLLIDQMVSLIIKTHKALLLFIWVTIICSNQVLAKSRHPISDTEIRERKTQCYADVESGLWGWQCKSSMVAKENCALRCLSPSCYELIYESDPLEEGEKDYVRSQEYKYCMHRLSLGESLDGVKGSFD